MPASENSKRALAMVSFSCTTPMIARIGAAWSQLMLGLALWATTQIEQVAASVRAGWLWTDSAATIHNIKDRQSQAGHRTHERMSYFNSEYYGKDEPTDSEAGTHSFPTSD